MTDEEREIRLAADVREALGNGPPSTPEARARIMEAVRAAGAMPRAGASRPGWRSPGVGLLVAASIAGIIALVRARGISYVPEPVPGIDRPAQPAAAAAPTQARSVGAVSDNAAVRVQFVLVAPDAKSVAVVGDFNDWNPSATPLESARGMWSSEEVVTAGRHDYAFVIDGTRWIADPSAPRAPADELGGGYSVLVAGAKP
jgi:predicted carbohydrate-binding protein with CBM48